MPEKNKKRSSPENTMKAKLRTAGDVISRLRWSGETDASMILVGYEDRIKGPMEKPVLDFKSVDQGGDIPEHRIQYFRSTAQNNVENSILWDREGRVDRIFGSGFGSHAPVSPQTVVKASEAAQNMIRIHEENMIRKAEKAKMRARQRARRMHTTALNRQTSGATPSLAMQPTLHARHIWKHENCWHQAGSQELQDCKNADKASSGDTSTTRPLKVITWNVMFDVFQDEIALFDGDQAVDRWERIIDILSEEQADIIALQEVTPSFVQLLCARTWIKNQYATSASPSNLESVSPHGNMTLWNKQIFAMSSSQFGAYQLLDGHRTRATVVVLKVSDEPSRTLLVANVHLPADGHCSNKTRLPRELARRRELTTIIGKLQSLEQSIARESKAQMASSIILGDYNVSQENELEDGCFSGSSRDVNSSHGYYSDAWSPVAHGRSGYTVDPVVNPRAHRSALVTGGQKGGRRIDRIYVKGSSIESSSLKPLEGKLLGKYDDSTKIPPSDHYGVAISFTFQNGLEHQESEVGSNPWAATALPSTDALLAVVLDEDSIGQMPLFDLDSSLPIPNITLLHGFAEISSKESLTLATETVEKAIQSVIDSDQSVCLPLTSRPFSAFEHQNSATLVCIPDAHSKEGTWLHHLYKTLRSSFRRCHIQEKRFENGYCPHVSIRKFGTVQAAREEARQLCSQLSNETKVRARSVSIFQRGQLDGKFYEIASIPLIKKPLNLLHHDPTFLLKDSGQSLFEYQRLSSIWINSEVERICKAASYREYGGMIEIASIVPFGSQALHACLPGMSDIDLVVEVRASSVCNNETSQLEKFSMSHFLCSVGKQLKETHSNSRVRLRICHVSGVAIQVLTTKLFQTSPSVDLLVCLKNKDDSFPDQKSKVVSQGVADNQWMIRTIQDCSNQFCLPYLPQAFEGALRIVKSWAYRRNIYGSSTGFLGGGGWGVLLAHMMLQGIWSGEILTKMSCTEEGSISTCSWDLASYFFTRTAGNWDNQLVISLHSESENRQAIERIKEITNRALKRGTFAVLSPISNEDHARNLTPSTTNTIKAEFQRASSILSCSHGTPEQVLDVFGPKEALGHDDAVLVLAVDTLSCQGSLSIPELKAWGSRQLLHLLVALEVDLKCSAIRPLSRPRIQRNMLTFTILVQSHPENISAFVRAQSRFVEENFGATFQDVVEHKIVQLRCISAIEAMKSPKKKQPVNDIIQNLRS